MGPLVLPGFLALGSLWALTRDEAPKAAAPPPVRRQPVFSPAARAALVAPREGGGSCFHPAVAQAILESMKTRGVRPMPVQGNRAPVYTLSETHEPGASAAQFVAMGRARGFAVVGTLSLTLTETDSLLLFVPPEQVASVTGPSSAFALLAEPLPKSVTIKAAATPPAKMTELDPELPDVLAAEVRGVLAATETDVGAIRAMAQSAVMKPYPKSVLALEGHAAALEARNALRAMKIAPAPPPAKKSQNGASSGNGPKAETVKDEASVVAPKE